MALRNLGVLEWSGGRDKELHRFYNVKFLVESDSILDGPQRVTFASGLPNVGSHWTYGNDNDVYALCTPEISCETVIKREANYYWILGYTFTTRPWLACLTTDITDPITQPDYIGGSFVTYQERTNRRRDGDPIMSSSLEPIWVSVDKNRPTVTVTQTRLNLDLPLFASMIDTLNDSPLWGVAKRCVKLRNVPWKRLVWGKCAYYYQRTLEFEIKYDTFDETEIIDAGRRWLDPALIFAYGENEIDRTNPANFTTAVDIRGNVQKVVPLDGNGEQCTDPANHQHFIDTVELYNESNFLLLGIPVTL